MGYKHSVVPTVWREHDDSVLCWISSTQSISVRLSDKARRENAFADYTAKTITAKMCNPSAVLRWWPLDARFSQSKGAFSEVAAAELGTEAKMHQVQLS